jgi:hypothetical protein
MDIFSFGTRIYYIFHFGVLSIIFLSKTEKELTNLGGIFKKIIMKGIQGKLCIVNHIKHVKLSKDI